MQLTKEEFWAQTYLSIAKQLADRHSHAVRAKVGCIAVKDNRIISIGLNGMPSKWDNDCEVFDVDGKLVSKPEVLHAETNCISKLARSNENGQDAVIYVTHAPCLQCAKIIYQTGIKKVFFHIEYSDCSGIEFLTKCHIVLGRFDDLVKPDPPVYYYDPKCRINLHAGYKENYKTSPNL